MFKLFETKKRKNNQTTKPSLSGVLQEHETELKIDSFFELQEEFDNINSELIKLKNNALPLNTSPSEEKVFQDLIEHIFEIQEELENKLSELKQARLVNDQSLLDQIFNTQEELEKTIHQLKKENQDNEKILLDQLLITQEELDLRGKETSTLNKKIKELEDKNKSFNELKSKIDSEKNKAIADKKFVEKRIFNLQAEYEKSKKTIENLNAELLNRDLSYQDIFKKEKASTAEKIEQNKIIIKINEKLLKHELQNNELAEKYNALKLNNEELVVRINSLSATISTLKSENEKLKTELVEKRELEASNESMLLHLHHIQEELETHYFKSQVLSKENDSFKARWSRLEKKIPNYFDSGALDLMSYDSVSVDQQAIWRLTDCFGRGYSFSEIIFKTVFQDGLLGLAVCESLQYTSKLAFYPSLVDKDESQTLLFNSLKTTEWNKLLAVANAIEQLTDNKWKDFIVKFDFDTAFFNPAFIKVPKIIKTLPSILRFDRIRMKRELQNGDYEHLWLDLFGVSYKDIYKKKVEVRIGAANVIASKQFSRYPKFEFPLIDGKDKPFDSWFAEASDDFGQKFELRFALDKQSFDLNVWSKLSVFDQDFLYQIITEFPNILQSLENENISINRDWDDWITLSKESASLLTSVKTLLSRIEKQRVAGLKTQIAKVEDESLGESVNPGAISGDKADLDSSKYNMGLISLTKTTSVLATTQTAKALDLNSNKRIKTVDNLTPVSPPNKKLDASSRVKNNDQTKAATHSKVAGAAKEFTIAPKKKLLSQQPGRNKL
jgi:hypothetical protein